MAWAGFAGGGPSPLPPPHHPLLTNGAAATAAAITAQGNSVEDFKLVLDPEGVEGVLGGGAIVAGLVGCLERVLPLTRGVRLEQQLSPRAVLFVLRRTTGTGSWINFHVDTAGATVQIPLSTLGGGEGGRVVYALPTGGGKGGDWELVIPPRTQGVPMAHHGDVVHGVTALGVGVVRYGLFGILAREDLPRGGAGRDP